MHSLVVDFTVKWAISLSFLQMLEYEYEPEMEESYRTDFFKSFKKTVEKGYFSFIIIDAVNDKVEYAVI